VNSTLLVSKILQYNILSAPSFFRYSPFSDTRALSFFRYLSLFLLFSILSVVAHSPFSDTCHSLFSDTCHSSFSDTCHSPFFDTRALSFFRYLSLSFFRYSRTLLFSILAHSPFFDTLCTRALRALTPTLLLALAPYLAPY